METILINRKGLTARGVRVTCYVEEVIDRGHIPGVLSGAALKGKASKYGGSYARTRENVSAVLAQVGIKNKLFLNPETRRYQRVWVKDGQRVQLVLD